MNLAQIILFVLDSIGYTTSILLPHRLCRRIKEITAKSTASSTSPFFLLPPELRLHLYERIVGAPRHSREEDGFNHQICQLTTCPCRVFSLLSYRLPVIHGYHRILDRDTAALVTTCRQLHEEVHHMRDVKAEFLFRCGESFCMFVNRLNLGRRNNIRKIVIKMDDIFFMLPSFTSCSLTRGALLVRLNMQKLHNLEVLRLDIARPPNWTDGGFCSNKWLAQGAYELLRCVPVSRQLVVRFFPYATESPCRDPDGDDY